MTEALHDSASTDPALPETGAPPAFYIVSARKFTILYLVTFGLYGFYWFYKNWANYRDARPASPAEASIWPIPRAIFSIFFIHSLFRKIKHFGQEDERVQRWKNSAHAWLLVALMLLSSVFDRLSARGVGSPLTDAASVAMLVPMLFGLLHAQRMANRACRDPEGAGNDEFTNANWVWIILGCIVWAMAALRMMSGAPDGGGDTF